MIHLVFLEILDNKFEVSFLKMCNVRTSQVRTIFFIFNYLYQSKIHKKNVWDGVKVQQNGLNGQCYQLLNVIKHQERINLSMCNK